jgi:hypothetical protein
MGEHQSNLVRTNHDQRHARHHQRGEHLGDGVTHQLRWFIAEANSTPSSLALSFDLNGATRIREPGELELGFLTIVCSRGTRALDHAWICSEHSAPTSDSNGMEHDSARAKPQRASMRTRDRP